MEANTALGMLLCVSVLACENDTLGPTTRGSAYYAQALVVERRALRTYMYMLHAAHAHCACM